MGRRSQIIEVTRDLFLEQGIEGVSMRKIARLIGISAPALYRHFASKDALLAAVVSEGRSLLAAALFRALEGRTPRERLRLAGLRYLDFAFEHPQYYKVFFMSWDKLDTEVHGGPDGKEGRYPATLQFVLDRVLECFAAGDFPPDSDPFEMVMLLWAQCHGLASFWVAGAASEQQTLEQYRALCERVTARVLAGVMV